MIVINSCQDSTGPKIEDDDLYLVKIYDLQIPEEILDQEPFEIAFSAYIGDNNCYSFFEIDTICDPGKIDIYIWGKYDSTSTCTTASQIIEDQILTFKPPFTNPLIINFYQPDDTIITDTINVLYMSQDPDWINYTKNSSVIPSNNIYALAIDLDDNLWVGTEDYATGIFRFDGIEILDFSDRRFELNQYYVESITVDRHGNIWVGSFLPPEISKYDGSDWQVFNFNPEIDHDDVHALVVDLDNNLWIGTHHSHLYRFDGNTFTEIDTVNSIYSGYIEALDIDSQNNLWFGYYLCTVGKYNDDELLIFNDSDLGLSQYYNFINDLKIDSHDRVFITTSGKGLLVFNNDTWANYDMSNSNIPTNNLYDLCIDSQDNIWVASGVGLLKFDGIEWVLYNYENSGLIDNSITSLAIDSNDQIWIGNYTYGITLFKNGN
ncbi:MAG: two-component regulator propeller domain-containing protein [Candidatus Neomarinimicrobiota bacterium]